MNLKELSNGNKTEDQKLLNLYSKYPDNWVRISEKFHNRDADECRARYYNVKTKANVNQGRWSKDEVELMLKYHRKFKNNWALISRLIKTRTANQIKDKVKELNKNKKPAIPKQIQRKFNYDIIDR